MPRPPVQRPRRTKGTGAIKYNKARNIHEGAIMLPGDTTLTYVTGATYAEVDAKLLRLLERARMAATGADEPLGEYLDRWLAQQPDLAPGTRRIYARSVRDHLLPLRHIPLGALTVANVEDTLYWLMVTRDPPLARASVANVQGLLARALRVAERRDLIARNAAERAELPGRPARPAEITPLTPDEARDLLVRIQGDPFEALYVLVLACGMRQGEALGLRWQDVDLDAGIVHVRVKLERLTEEGKPYEWALTRLKTAASRRVIHLPAVAVTALRLHKARQDAERTGRRPAPRRWGRAKRTRDKGLGWRWGLVFTMPEGEPIHRYVIAERFKRYAPAQKFHNTRHFAASFLVAQGVPERVVMDILGHTNSAMTRHYAHVYDASRVDAAARIEAALVPRSGDDSGDNPAGG